MRYLKTLEYSGSEATVISTIENALLPNDFRILDKGSTMIDLRGPGMTSNRQNPIRGATHIHIEARDGRLHLQANLGGVLFMVLFVCLFPVLMCGGFALAPVFTSNEGLSAFNREALQFLLVWLVVSPILSLWIRKCTVRALDNLLENAALIAARGEEGNAT